MQSHSHGVIWLKLLWGTRYVLITLRPWARKMAHSCTGLLRPARLHGWHWRHGCSLARTTRRACISSSVWSSPVEGMPWDWVDLWVHLGVGIYPLPLPHLGVDFYCQHSSRTDSHPPSDSSRLGWPRVSLWDATFCSPSTQPVFTDPHL